MSTRPDVKSIFEKALELAAPADRAAYLDEACGGNAALRAEIEGLLEALDRAGGFLNRSPAAEAATGAFAAADASGLTRPEGPATGPVVPADLQGVAGPVDAATGPLAPGLPSTDPYPGADESIGVLLAGKYKLIEVIGEGGMGSVYMAQQTEPVKRKVAVKLIKAGMDSRAVLARFEAERQALAMMDHPNIAKVLDAGAAESGRPFFVMELVKGVPITKFCDARKLTPRERLELFVPVCQAIQHAHQKGVIHRDIKPSNVLVAMYDDRPVPKVIDFGVAKATGQALTDMTLNTGFGAVIGTPEYMSPEQASFNNLDIDTRSDVYSLGVLLYELLAGSPPFARKELEAAGLLEILRVIREQEPPRPSTRLSSADALPSLAANRGTEPKRLTALVRGELDWIAMKSLEKDRNRRYETANGFAADVQRYLTGEPVQAVPPSMRYRARKFLRKHRGPVTAAALVLLALVGGIIGTTVGLFRAETAKEAETQAKLQAQQERDEKEQARKETDEQRKRAEYQAASIGIDLDMEGQPEPKIELLRHARRLLTIPEHSPELKEFIIRRMLVLGQEIRRNTEETTLWDTSPDGLALSEIGGAVVLREILTGRQVAIIRSQAGSYYGSFVAQGQLIALPGYPNQPVELWDTSGRLIVRTKPFLERRSIKISSDGLRLLVTKINNENIIISINLYDIQSGKLIDILFPYIEKKLYTNFSYDNKWIIIAGQNTVNIYSAYTGQFISELMRSSNIISDISISPDGKYVAVLEGMWLHRWRTGDWVAKESQLLPTNAHTNWENIRWFSNDKIGILSDKNGLSSNAKYTFIMGLAIFPGNIVDIQGNFAIRDDSAIINLSNGKPIHAISGKRLSKHIELFNIANRFLINNNGIYDIYADKYIDKNDNQSVLINSIRFIQVFNSVKMVSPGHLYMIPIDSLPIQETIVLWAKLISRGEMDEAGDFIPWTETIWEENRRILARLLSGTDRDILLHPVASDALFWLRQEAQAVKIENMDDLFLLNRLGCDRRAGPGKGSLRCSYEASLRRLAAGRGS